MSELPDGHPSVVDLYSVCIGLAIANSSAREYLKDKDKLFEAIHEKDWEKLQCLMMNLLGSQPVRDDQGKIIVNGQKYSHVYQALMHRLKCIGSFASLKLEQQKAASVFHALCAVMLSKLSTEVQERPNLDERERKLKEEQVTVLRNGLLMLGDGRQTEETAIKEKFVQDQLLASSSPEPEDSLDSSTEGLEDSSLDLGLP